MKIMYIRSTKKSVNKPVGCIVSIQNDTPEGKFLSLGWSYCSKSNADTFSRKAARKIALGRANAHMNVFVPIKQDDTAHTVRERILNTAIKSDKIPSGLRHACSKVLKEHLKETESHNLETNK